MASLSENRALGNDRADLYNQLWHECAGLTTKVPQIGDMVFYFPQGHFEMIKECMKDGDVTGIPTYHLPPKILCKVVDVELKAFPDSDEMFAEIGLVPDSEEGEKPTFGSVPQKIPANSFQKILTISDASTHGGCGLPKAYVEKTFPPLDASQEQASQDLVARDLHGATWNFRHIYRGNPKRHMLVNGWNKFASEKKLKAGDTCIFMKGLGQNEIYVGIQRAIKITKVPTDLPGPTMRHGVLVNASVAMDTRCKFTVNYHPRMCGSAFIVSYDKVMEALKVNYSPEMRIEMLVAGGGGEDPEHIPKKFSGIITAKEDADPARWPNSEWRCLKVQWDVTSTTYVLPPRVNPWDILPARVDVPHTQSSVSVDRKRPMPFEPMIRNSPFSRTNENNQLGGWESQELTLSIVNTGSSSRQHETNLADDEQSLYLLAGQAALELEAAKISL